MSQLLSNDKALVILAVFGIVVIYMFMVKIPSESILNAALAGLFGIAVGQSLKGGGA